MVAACLAECSFNPDRKNGNVSFASCRTSCVCIARVSSSCLIVDNIIDKKIAVPIELIEIIGKAMSLTKDQACSVLSEKIKRSEEHTSELQVTFRYRM